MSQLRLCRVLVAAPLLLAACGGGGSNANPDAGTAGSPDAAPAASQDAASTTSPDGAPPDAAPPCLPTIFDDPFDDGDLGAGGTNGGFVPRNNGISGDNSTVSELEGVARILTAAQGAGGEPNVGLGSIASIDATSAATDGLTIRWEITYADPGVWNGIALYLARDDVFYENNVGVALKITGSPADYFAPYHVGMQALAGGLHFYADEAYDMAALADGFIAELEISDGGWALRVDGLMSDGTTISANGVWEAGFAYADLFDADIHVGAAIQAENSDTTSRRFDVDRITVFSGICAP
jgi:hypothetical protein